MLTHCKTDSCLSKEVLLAYPSTLYTLLILILHMFGRLKKVRWIIMQHKKISILCCAVASFCHTTVWFKCVISHQFEVVCSFFFLSSVCLPVPVSSISLISHLILCSFLFLINDHCNTCRLLGWIDPFFVLGLLKTKHPTNHTWYYPNKR